MNVRRLLSSVALIEWVGPDTKGKTKYFQISQPFIIIEEEIKYKATIKQNPPVTLKLISKSIMGKEEVLGETIIKAPDSILQDKTVVFSRTIETTYGGFQINLSFSILSVDQISFIPKPKQKLANIETYKALVHDLSENPFNQGISTWGKDGIFDQLNIFSDSKFTTQTLSNLASFSDSLTQLSEFSNNTAKIFSKFMYYLSEPEPSFLTIDNRIIHGNEVSQERLHCYSLLSLCICEETAVYFKRSQTSDYSFIEIPLMSVCTSFGHILEDPICDVFWVIFVICTSLFCSKYIQNHFLPKLPTVINTFNLISTQATKCFVQKMIDIIQNQYQKPRLIINLFERYQTFFELTLYSNEIWNELYIYLIHATDFYVTREFMLKAQVPFQIDPQKYKEIYPEYNWPLISTLNKIVKNIEHFMNGEIRVNTLPTEFNGLWMYELMKRYNQKARKQINEEKIAKMYFDNPNFEPQFRKFDNYVKHSQYLSSLEIEISEPIPKIPEIKQNMSELNEI